MTKMSHLGSGISQEMGPGDREIVTAFGPESEARAAIEEGAGLFDLSHEGRFRITGGDALKHLHGLCTQAVENREPLEGGLAYVLDRKGKVLADLRFVLADDGDILCQVPPGLGDALRKWIDLFVINRDVTIENLDDTHAVLALAGPRTEHMLQAVGLPALPDTRDAAARGEHGGAPVWVQRDEDLAETGARLIVPAASAESLAAALLEAGATPLGARDHRLARTLRATPAWGAEIGENVLPAEAGQKGRAVSFTKGCYCGQEVIAMQHFRGKPRRRLVRLAIVEGSARDGLHVHRESKRIGELTTVAGDRALAVLNGAEHEVGEQLTLMAQDEAVGQARIELVADDTE